MDFIFSIVFIFVLALIFYWVTSCREKSMRQEFDCLKANLKQFFNLCRKQAVPPKEWIWDKSFLLLPFCFEYHFAGYARDLWMDPIEEALKSTEKVYRRLKSLMSLFSFRAMAIFGVVAIIRTSCEYFSPEPESDLLFSISCFFLAFVGVISVLQLLKWKIDRVFGVSALTRQIISLIELNEDEAMQATCYLEGLNFHSAVKEKQDSTMDQSYQKVLNDLAKVSDVIPVVVFFLFCLLSVCFLFFPILGMMHRLEF